VALKKAMEQWSYSNCDVLKGGALAIAGFKAVIAASF